MTDPVILALINRLPEAGAVWPLSERVRWLCAMEGVLNLVYHSVDNIPIAAKLQVGEVDQETVERILAIESKGSPVVSAEPETEKFNGDGGDMEGGRPNPKERRERSSGRPAGTPDNLALALEAIDHFGGRASSNQIAGYVQEKWWPDLPKGWRNCLWGLASDEKVGRDGINFCRVKNEPKPLQPFAGADRKAATPKSRQSLPAPKRFAAAESMVRFEHADMSIDLPARGYVMASKLKAVIGQHIGEAFLAEKVLGSNSEGNRNHVRDVCLGMNEALAEVGLKIQHYPGHGLMMKEV